MFLTKHVFLKILCGSPTSLSFLTTLAFPASSSVTTPVAATRNLQAGAGARRHVGRHTHTCLQARDPA